MRQVQDDLAKLTQSLEEIKGVLKILVEVNYLILKKNIFIYSFLFLE
jgi:hypothetical protein